MAQYKTQPGQSPAMIARALGTSVSALLSANPHKPTTVVAGRRTWRGLNFNERLNVPAGSGALGDMAGTLGATSAQVTAAAAMNAALSTRGYKKSDQSLYMAFQRAMGSVADGFPGTGTMGKLQTVLASAGVPMAPVKVYPWKSTGAYDGVNAPTTAEWLGAGGGTPTATPTVTPTVAPASGLAKAANAALLALGADPNYCVSVKRTGTAVNTAVHNFKAAWNAANPKNPVPIGTGNYEPSVAAALGQALPVDVNVPPGCGVTMTQAVVTANQTQQTVQAEKVAQQVNAGGSSGPAQGVTVAAVPAAVQALVGINPCLETNSGKVYAAQTALGIKADGKYGPGTSAAARALGINAPAACSPAPMWWGVKGTAQATAATQTAAAAAPTAVAAHPIVTAAATTAAAVAQATEAVAKSAQASTQTQADDAATTAQAAKDAAARAAAAATTQAQADAAESARKLAQAALDAAAEKGGTASTAITPEKKISTGAIVAGAVGAAALVGLIAYAVTKKPGARGKRGKPGKRGPAKRRVTKRKPAKRSKRK